MFPALRRFPAALLVVLALVAIAVDPPVLSQAQARTAGSAAGGKTTKQAKKSRKVAKKKATKKKKAAKKTSVKHGATKRQKKSSTPKAKQNAAAQPNGTSPTQPSNVTAPSPAAQAPAQRAEASPRAEAAQPTDAKRVGLATHLVWVSENEAYAQLRVLSAGGVHTIREDFDWSLTEQMKGQLDWTRIDRVVAAAARAGISVLGIVDYTPAWASSDPSGAKSKFFAPTSTAAYAAFAATVASRYAVGGAFWASRPDLPVTPLAGIELWNEPYGKWFFKPTPSPSAYASMVKQAAVRVHDADPDVPVVASGNLWANFANGTIGPWVSRVLDAEPSLATLVDVWAVHPYETNRGVGPDGRADPRFGFGSIPDIHTALVAHGSKAPIWITEIGWSTAADATGAVSEAQQAAFMARALQRSFGDFGSYVKRVYLFSWDSSNGSASDFDGNQGLRRADGSYKPAWQAIKSYIASA
jgi:polysaccharide biosynthesis protein PslG